MLSARPWERTPSLTGDTSLCFAQEDEKDVLCRMADCMDDTISYEARCALPAGPLAEGHCVGATVQVAVLLRDVPALTVLSSPLSQLSRRVVNSMRISHAQRCLKPGCHLTCANIITFPQSFSRQNVVLALEVEG